MAANYQFYLTALGKDLEARAQTGETITFTRVAIGDGVWPTDTDPETVTALLAEQISYPINSVSVPTPTDGMARIEVLRTNSGLTSPVYQREIGLFAVDPDDSEAEILYAVSIIYENPVMLPASGAGLLTEEQMVIVTQVGNATDVTAEFQDGLVFVGPGDVATAPTADKIPRADEYGQLNRGWLDKLTTMPVGDVAGEIWGAMDVDVFSQEQLADVVCYGDSYIAGSATTGRRVAVALFLRALANSNGFDFGHTGIVPINRSERRYDETVSFGEGYEDWTETPTFSGGNYGDPSTWREEAKYAPCVGCIVNDTDGVVGLEITFEQEVDAARIYYLQQPGGGSFDVGPPGRMVSVNTDGSYGPAVASVSELGEYGYGRSIFIADAAPGVTIYAVEGRRESLYVRSGVRVSVLGHGSVTMTELLALQGRQFWLGGAFATVIHCGFNDIFDQTVVPDQATITSRVGGLVDQVREASPSAHIIFLCPVRPPELTEEMARIKIAAHQKAAVTERMTVLDLENLVGEHAAASASGLMAGDGYHLNEAGCSIVAAHLYKLLGLDCAPSPVGFRSTTPRVQRTFEPLPIQSHPLMASPRWCNQSSSHMYLEAPTNVVPDEFTILVGGVILNTSGYHTILAQDSGGTDPGRMRLALDGGHLSLRIGETIEATSSFTLRGGYPFILAVGRDAGGRVLMSVNGFTVAYHQFPADALEITPTLMFRNTTAGSSYADLEISFLGICDSFVSSDAIRRFVRGETLDMADFWPFGEGVGRVVSSLKTHNHWIGPNGSAWSENASNQYQLRWHAVSDAYLGGYDMVVYPSSYVIDAIYAAAPAAETISVGTSAASPESIVASTVLTAGVPTKLSLIANSGSGKLYITTTGSVELTVRLVRMLF